MQRAGLKTNLSTLTLLSLLLRSFSHVYCNTFPDFPPAPRQKLATRLGLTALMMALLVTMGFGPAASAQSVAPTQPSAPASPQAPYNPWLLNGINGSGGIYIGAIPPNSANKPVLVFVAGKSGKAQDWWSDTYFSGHNDMYDYAY